MSVFEIWLIGGLAFALAMLSIDIAKGNDCRAADMRALLLAAVIWPVAAPLTAAILLHDAVTGRR